MKLLDELLAHPDISVITDKQFLKNDPLSPQETRLMQALRIHPSSFRFSTDKPIFWIRVRESATKKRLGDFHFFEPGGAYRSDLVQAALLTVQRNRRFREARALRKYDTPLKWEKYMCFYLLGVSCMFLIYVMIRYFYLDENRL